MKIQPKNTLLPKILIALGIVVFLVSGYLAYAYYSESWPFEAPKATVNTSESDSEADKPISTTTDSKDSDDPTANTPVQSTPPSDEAESKNTLSGIINYKDVVDSSLTIRTTITQLLDSGTCKLTLTSESGKTVTRSANIISNPTTSSCDGFSIPTSELSSGKWTIVINLNSNDESGTLKGTVDI